jgi:KUP system potassium uptake protein
MAELKIPGVTFNPADTSYFLGRRTVLPTHDHGLRRLQDLLFIALNRNSADPSEVFAIPPGRVVEMGVQVAV